MLNKSYAPMHKICACYRKFRTFIRNKSFQDYLLQSVGFNVVKICLKWILIPLYSYLKHLNIDSHHPKLKYCAQIDCPDIFKAKLGSRTKKNFFACLVKIYIHPAFKDWHDRNTTSWNISIRIRIRWAYLIHLLTELLLLK